ncbi:MAG: bacteriohemerythrin [Bacteroidetes bacterium]|nr:bacteriohemerythrin [Bacteroidota bacterium]
MANSEYIIWKKDYETGIVMVDRQHRILVDLINKLKDAHNQKKEKEVLRETIIKLVDYTKFHFGYEEKHMTQFAYNKLDGHKLQHQVFVKQIVDVLENLKLGKYENLTEEILNFLSDWLIEHILKQDKEYSKFYKMKIKYA